MAESTFGNDGLLVDSINTTGIDTGSTTHIIYNNTNKTIDFTVDTSAAVSLDFRPSFHHPDGQVHEDPAGRTYVTMEAGESIFVTATATSDGQNFNIDRVRAGVRHRLAPTFRHYFRKENGLSDEGVLIVTPDITPTP